jgi:hypothetical protein
MGKIIVALDDEEQVMLQSICIDIEPQEALE